MLDSIKVGIPLNQRQHKRIGEKVFGEREQWVLYHPKTGELQFRRVRGLVNCDQHSYHRQILFDMRPDYIEGETKFVVELSLPKYYYGHNISLLYEYTKALTTLKVSLEDQFGLKRNKLADIAAWEISRLDLCYAWQFPSQDTCHKYLDSLKRLHFPRKNPIIYPESILFAGATYSVKFYEKLPEFKKHDRKALLKDNANPEYINHLEQRASGVLRYEVTLRRQYLKKHGLLTVGDLLKPEFQMVFDDHLSFESQEETQLAIVSILGYWLVQKHGNSFKLEDLKGHETPITNGDRIEAPPGLYVLNGVEYNHQGGGFTIVRQDKLVGILSYMLIKFLGANVCMQTCDQIKIKLLEHYKPVKASRLVGFWLYVQKFGTQDAKQAYGERSYYSSKRDLKAASVSLVEPNPKVVPIDHDFLSRFRLQVPSEDVVNKHDDYRDHDNILNFRVAR